MIHLLDSNKAFVILFLLVLMSAFAIVYSTYSTRLAFMQWQEILSETQKLDVEWGRLLIEKSSSSSYIRLEKIATEKLGMVVPEGERLVVIREGGL